MINPYVCPIEGDLSRADTVVLGLLCRNKRVIEFGSGGSTIFLSQTAKSVKSYETDQIWMDRVKERLAQITDKMCEPELVLIDKNADGSSVHNLPEECDVLFDDGWSMMRDHFLMDFWPKIKICAILHDGRMAYPANVLKKFLDAWEGEAVNILPINNYLGSLKSIEWNYLDSNMVVLFKKDYVLKHEDWKQTEADNNRQGWGKA